MIDFGKYTVVVLSAYGVSVALLVGLVAQTLIANAKARRALEEHEKNG
ncbi:heme exporter protein CcmD [Paracoccus aminophilus]|uniref:Heme exporter protein D n=1 Tax=Paracoccus aminophilus JCM 7686 TaxID=1367847 RepID=S5Y9Q6_PARAH|nr:heme exporter protein CcmD [Paracoccus aminophilus]AGT08068.1 heme exporter protein D [Paracoccus aminophilus JCM 7686]